MEAKKQIAAFVNGLFSACSVVGTLSTKYSNSEIDVTFILYDHKSSNENNAREYCDSLAQKISSIYNQSLSFIWLNNYLTEGIINKLTPDNFKKRLNLKKFYDDVEFPVHKVNEIYLESFHAPPAKSMSLLFPNSDIYLYDEGLMSYAPQREKFDASYADRVKGLCYHNYLNKLSPFLLKDEQKEVLQINKRKMKSIFNKLSVNFFNTQEIKHIINPDNNYVLLVGQYINEWNLISFDEELYLYETVARDLIKKGYRVYFKDHPKSQGSFSNRLKAEFKGDISIIDVSIPVEIFYKSKQLAAVCSIYSTALFVASHFYNVPAFTFGTKQVSRAILNKLDSNCFCMMVADRYLPDISELPVNKSVQGEILSEIKGIFQRNLNSLLNMQDHPLFLLRHYLLYEYMANEIDQEQLKKLFDSINADQLCYSYFTQVEKGKYYKTMYAIDQYKYDISVILPVYNGEQYVERAITSIVKNSGKSIEIVCVNDGSKDSTKRILDNLKKQYKNMKVIHKRNEGVSIARNVGILHSSGKYISFVDADDYIDHEMFQSLFEKAESENLDFVKSDYINITSNESWVVKPYYSVPRNKVLTSYTKGYFSFVGLWTGLYRRNILLQTGLFPSEYHTAEDRVVNWFLIIKSKRYMHVDSAFYYYDRTNESAVTARCSDKHMAIFSVYEVISSLVYRLGIFGDICHDLYLDMFNVYEINYSKKERVPRSSKYNYMLNCCFQINRIPVHTLRETYRKLPFHLQIFVSRFLDNQRIKKILQKKVVTFNFVVTVVKILKRSEALYTFLRAIYRKFT